jgi:hypothetical protein
MSNLWNNFAEWNNYASAWQRKKDQEEDNKCRHEKNCGCKKSFEKTVDKSFDISVPLVITPFAVPEKPGVKNLSEMETTSYHKTCEDENGKKYRITQKISVCIPIELGADICYDKTCANEADDETIEV